MKKFKKRKIVILPINGKAPIIGNKKYSVQAATGELRLRKDCSDSWINSFTKSKWINYNLYFLSDDKIKKGDWFIEFDLKGTRSSYCNKPFLCDVGNTGNFILTKNSGNFPFPEHCKKIIATTDETLCHHNPEYDSRSKTGREFIFLPQPSEDFIKAYVEDYNKGNIITHIDVEYTNRCCGRCDGVHDFCTIDIECGKHGVEGCEICFGKCGDILTVNSKNEISVKDIKSTWTRNEVITLIKEFDNSTRTVREKEIQFRNKWFEDNL